MPLTKRRQDEIRHQLRVDTMIRLGLQGDPYEHTMGTLRLLDGLLSRIKKLEALCARSSTSTRIPSEGIARTGVVIHLSPSEEDDAWSTPPR
jgi:hypothetical protein